MSCMYLNAMMFAPVLHVLISCIKHTINISNVCCHLFMYQCYRHNHFIYYQLDSLYTMRLLVIQFLFYAVSAVIK